MQALQKSNDIRCFLLCIALSISAALLNLFASISVYGSLNIYLGSFIVLLSLLTLPLKCSCIVLLSNLASFYYEVGHALFVIVLILEYIFIFLALRYDWRFLNAVFTYWILIGLPVLFFIFYLVNGQDFESSLFVTGTLGLNGLLVSVLAIFVYWFIPNSSQFKRPPSVSTKFSTLVFELCFLSLLLPAILTTLVLTWGSTHETENQLMRVLSNTGENVNNLLNEKINRSLFITAEVADVYDPSQPSSSIKLLNASANANPDIESMLVSDANGEVILAAPSSYAQILSQIQQLNISERPYFSYVKQHNEAYVSGIIEGKGFGNLDLVMVSFPIKEKTEKNRGEFNGIVQSTTRLQNIIDYRSIEIAQSQNIDFVVVDPTGRIAYASDALGLDLKSDFKLQPSSHIFLKKAPAMKINDRVYMYHHTRNGYGWGIYSIMPPSEVFSKMVTYFLYIAITLFISILLIALVAKRLSMKFTKPLVDMQSFLLANIDEKELAFDANISIEMHDVADSLIKARNVSNHFQSELTQQVADKTAELQKLNQQLFNSAQRDALTQLLNRGAFDKKARQMFEQCSRTKQSYSIMLLDIDLFKAVNDTYGHIVGDQCIIHTANVLTQECNKTKSIVARYGGEEYIIMIEGENHQALAERIRIGLEADPLYYDGISVPLTVSIGVVSISKDFNQKLEKIIALADELLYTSKNNGRNQITAQVV